MNSLLELNLGHTKLTDRSISDLSNLYKTQDMPLQSLDLHGNSITSDGFESLVYCLKANNRVKSLNLSKNLIATDHSKFSSISHFLLANKVLEVLNLGFCEIKEEACRFIGEGLAQSKNLKKLILKGNEVKSGVNYIAAAFISAKRPLGLQELDLSKCQLESEHVSSDFTKFIISPNCALLVLNLRDNMIVMKDAEQILLSLKLNKLIQKLLLDHNPVK